MESCPKNNSEHPPSAALSFLVEEIAAEDECCEDPEHGEGQHDGHYGEPSLSDQWEERKEESAQGCSQGADVVV